MNQKPIFILGAHKSGTSLLRNILDGHPSLFVLPIEIHFFKHMNFWIDYPYREHKPQNGTTNFYQSALSTIHEYTRKNNKYADFNDHQSLNEKVFQDYLKAPGQSSQSEKELFELLINATHAAFYGHEMGEDKMLVEKSVENAEFALDLKRLYPEARFVHILRNPYANLVSFRKYRGTFKKGKREAQFPFLIKIINSLKNNYYYLEKNQRLIDNYYIIKYEDLVSNPKAQIRSLISFLGLPDHETIYRPTSMGKPWKGNSITDRNFKGISDQSIEYWREEITPIEINYVNKLVPHILEKYNYGKIAAREGTFKINKNESLKNFFLNRLYQYYINRW